MKKIFLTLILAVSAFSVFAWSPSTEDLNSPFELSWQADAPLMTAGVGFYGTGFVVRKFHDFDTIQLKELDDVNSFDRFFANPYNKKMDVVSDVLLVTAIAFPALTYGTEFFMQNLPLKDAVTLGVMYTESMLLTAGIKDVLKIIVQRNRPYTYYPDKEWPADFDDCDNIFSFPSGHTAMGFNTAAFMTYTFCTLYPESNWKIPVALSTYTMAAALGALRVGGGNHFMSDMLTGAAIGTVCGFGVPALHTITKKLSTQKTQVAVTPAALMISTKL